MDPAVDQSGETAKRSWPAVKDEEGEENRRSPRPSEQDRHGSLDTLRGSGKPVTSSTTRHRSESFERQGRRSKRRRTQKVEQDAAGASPKLEAVVVKAESDDEAETVAGPSSPPAEAENMSVQQALIDSKGKAREAEGMTPVESRDDGVEGLRQEIERLNKELSTKNEVILSQRSTISHIHHQCTCTICLELAWRPFILAPCGHTFCVLCLKSWFTKPLEREGALPTYMSELERAAEVKRRTLRRKKMCPACRTQLVCPPIEIWLVKGMLEKLDKSAHVAGTSESGIPDDTVSALELAKKRGEDLPSGPTLWTDVFDSSGPRRVLWDEEDGVRRCGECASEIFDGACTNPSCAIEYSDLTQDEFDSDGAASDAHYGDGPYHLANGAIGGPWDDEDDHGDDRSRDEHFSDSEDDMRSFIEDDDDGLAEGGEGSMDDHDDDDGFIAGPRRVYRSDRSDPIEISDDDEEDRPRSYRGHSSEGRSQLRDGSLDDGDRGSSRDGRGYSRTSRRGRIVESESSDGGGWVGEGSSSSRSCSTSSSSSGSRQSDKDQDDDGRRHAYRGGSSYNFAADSATRAASPGYRRHPEASGTDEDSDSVDYVGSALSGTDQGSDGADGRTTSDSVQSDCDEEVDFGYETADEPRSGGGHGPRLFRQVVVDSEDE